MLETLSAGQIGTFVLMSLALLALWVRGAEGSGALREWTWLALAGVALREWTWLALAGAAAAAALVSGVLQPLGLALLVLFGIASRLLFGDHTGAFARMASAVVVVVLAASFLLHLAPGFANPRVISSMVLKSGSIPYTKYLNFDKAALGLLLVAFSSRPLSSAGEWKRALARTVPVLAVTLGVVLALSLGMGYVKFDAGLSGAKVALLWAWTNLFFTCVAEEALFRGLIQRQLESGLGRLQWGRAAALVVASVIFGFAHWAGGWSYVGLSAAAGLGYGYAMQRTGRIEAAILAHFALNAIHFALFSYPALA